jgi:hypothetical protein
MVKNNPANLTDENVNTIFINQVIMVIGKIDIETANSAIPNIEVGKKPIIILNTMIGYTILENGTVFEAKSTHAITEFFITVE